MHIAHTNINQEEKPRKGKLSSNKEAIRAGLILWKLKHNAKLDKLTYQLKK